MLLKLIYIAVSSLLFLALTRVGLPTGAVEESASLLSFFASFAGVICFSVLAPKSTLGIMSVIWIFLNFMFLMFGFIGSILYIGPSTLFSFYTVCNISMLFTIVVVFFGLKLSINDRPEYTVCVAKDYGFYSCVFLFCSRSIFFHG